LAYESGPHALRQLMLLQKYGGRITKYPEKIIPLSGDSYYFVEVTTNEGTRYVIEAYGKEAIDLRCEVTDRKTEEKLIMTI
jgi:hypothetical protein